MAQNRETVTFYYLADDKIQQGSVDFLYRLKENDKFISLDDVIDFNNLNPVNLKLELKVSNLKWNDASHESRFKLIFGGELSNAEGLTQDAKGNIYLRTTDDKYFSFGFFEVDELSPAMPILAFLVADTNTSYEEAMADTGSDDNVFGFGAYMKIFFLLPKYYETTPEDKLTMPLFGATVGGLNDGFREMSYTVVQDLKKGELSGSIKEKLDTKTKIPSSSLGSKPSILSNEFFIVDPDQEAFIEARRGNTISSYEYYLHEHPDGNYTSEANNYILGFTPFRLTQSEATEEIAEVTFQVHTISFTDGVGYVPPLLQLTNNDDFAVRPEFLDAKTCVIKIPPDRTVDATFKLGQKDTTITLSNSLSIDLITTEKSIATNAIENNASAMEYTPERGKQSKNKTILAFLLALPFLGAIAYLIHRRYWL